MKTQMKSDALLDAFEKQQLNHQEMKDILGGWPCTDCAYYQYDSPGGSGVVTIFIHENGSQTYMLNDAFASAQDIMDLNDHWMR